MENTDKKRICGFDEGDMIKISEYPSDDQVRWGGCDDPHKFGVELNKPYKCERIEVHTYHTKIILKGVDGKFNSVSFHLV